MADISPAPVTELRDDSRFLYDAYMLSYSFTCWFHRNSLVNWFTVILCCSRLIHSFFIPALACSIFGQRLVVRYPAILLFFTLSIDILPSPL
nr:MAG TPA: hypothetical protein [Caudoviricetes sp.]